jgi:integrase
MEYNITYREKDGGWQYIISHKDNNGKWRQKSKQGFRKRSDAKKAADERLDKLKELFDLQKGRDDCNELTFGQAAKMFLNHVQLYKEYNTFRGYRNALEKFVDLNDMEITKVTNMHIQNCINKMVKEGLKSSSISSYVIVLKIFFLNAIKKQKIIVETPADDLTIPEDKEDKKIRALTKSQLDALLSKLSYDKYYVISLIAAKSGLRIGEIIGLTWDDIDFFKGTIKVNKQWKELKRGLWGFGPVKRKKSNRMVPAPQELLKELKKYKKNSPANIDGRLFFIHSTATASGNLQTIYERIGFNISVHDLRHTYATLLLSNGIDLETVAKLLGHKAEETMRTYSHVTSDMMDRATKAINEIFN